MVFFPVISELVIGYLQLIGSQWSLTAVNKCALKNVLRHGVIIF